MSALTKILIVLQLVFSLACSVLLVLMVSRTENFKTTSTENNTKYIGMAASYDKAKADVTAAEASQAESLKQAIAARAELAKYTAEVAIEGSKAEIAKLAQQTQLTTLSNQLAMLQVSLKTVNDSMALKDKELADLRPQVTDLVKKYNDIVRAKQEADNLLQAAEQSIRKYQIIIAQGSGGAGAIAPIGSGDQIQVLASGPAAGKVNGQITDVSQAAGRTLIEMPLGTRDGIKVGTNVYVYRANSWVGDATVQQVTPEQSVGVVMKSKAGEIVQKGDYVSTIGQ